MSVEISITDQIVEINETSTPVEIYVAAGAATAPVWGNITGTLSNQTDLQNALNAKFDDPTGTTAQYIRGDGSLATFVSSSAWGTITGTLSNQTDLQNALNLKYNNPTGTTSQYLRGDGTLATFPSLTGFVPYTGATGAVNLGAFDLLVQGLTIGKGNNSLVNNTALGHSTLLTITSGNFNTAVGYESLRNTTTGQYNTAIGQSSLFTNTTGSQNTALGLNALVFNTSGTSNVAVGLDGLMNNTTGSSNTAIGYNAGSHITGGSTPNTTASNSVFIGRDSKAAADGQTNQIVIGQNAVGNGSNTATFGNTLTTANYFTGSINGGSFVKSGGLSTEYLKADGSVSTLTNPITGTGASGQIAYFTGSTSQVGNNNLFYDATNVRLGVGTNTPQSNIQISENKNGITNLRISNTTAGTTSQAGLRLDSDASSGTMNIGKYSSTSTSYLSIAATDGYLSNANFGDITLQNEFATGKIKFSSGAASTAQMTLTAAGRLLLGQTTEDTQRLQVTGDVKFDSAAATNGFYWNNTTKNLGIGTTTPAQALSIIRNENTSSGIETQNLSTDAAANSGIIVRNSATSGQLFKLSTGYGGYKTLQVSDLGFYNAGAGDISLLNDVAIGKIKFLTGTASVAQMTLTSNGRLLLGSTSEDTQVLQVTGTAKITSKLSLGAGTTSNAQINLASSTAPTSPNNGDIWFDGTNLRMRIGGVTRTFTLI